VECKFCHVSGHPQGLGPRDPSADDQTPCQRVATGMTAAANVGAHLLSNTAGHDEIGLELLPGDELAMAFAAAL